MAISLVSPGIKITEQDLVSSSASAESTAGAFAGQFRWGPIDEPTVVANEADLVVQFGKPNSTTVVDFLSAANFLSYASALYVVRSANNTAKNATSEVTTGAGGVGTGLLIKNKDVYEVTTSFDVGPWTARYAGALGNSLKVSSCPSATAWQSSLTGTFTVTSGSTQVVGSGSAANTELAIGDLFVAGGKSIKVASIANATHFTLVSPHTTGVTAGSSAVRRWEFYGEFTAAPGTSTYAGERSSSNDEIHVVVVDNGGSITGAAGTVLEKFYGLSKGSDAKGNDGGSNYYKDIINNQSKYIYWTDHDAAGTNWGNSVTNTTFTTVSTVKNYTLAGGSDGGALTDGDKTTSFAYLSDENAVPASLIISGQATPTVINYIISEICNVRRDCVVCVSPLRANVVNNAGNEVSAIEAWAASITRSTYVFADSNWKYQYDKYNDTYVYVPCNPDIAGLMSRNDALREPWLSPAGPTNGVMNNVVKLGWNPRQNDRDALYKVAVNPVYTQIGRGSLLFGDKTFFLKNTSLNRINVRRLFIEVQKTISEAARNVLFDLNDEGTRSNFVNTIVPYLRSVQARRGISDFKVVCDTTNNTDEVINNNEFVCDVFIQPIRSVNFVQLNFVAVRGNASFNEVTG